MPRPIFEHDFPRLLSLSSVRRAQSTFCSSVPYHAFVPTDKIIVLFHDCPQHYITKTKLGTHMLPFMWERSTRTHIPCSFNCYWLFQLSPNSDYLCSLLTRLSTTKPSIFAPKCTLAWFLLTEAPVVFTHVLKWSGITSWRDKLPCRPSFQYVFHTYL